METATILFTYQWLYLTIVYVVLVAASALAVLLYIKAYIEMKRSPMILSVVILLSTLLLENIYFLVVTIVRGYQHNLIAVLENPVIWSIPKLLMLYGIANFIKQSVTPCVTDLNKIKKKN